MNGQQSNLETENISLKPGVAKIKNEFIVTDHDRSLEPSHITEEDKIKLDVTAEDQQDVEQPSKKPRLSKKEKKKLRGQNKNRGPTYILTREQELCPTLNNSTKCDILNRMECPRQKCQNMHDLDAYLAIKPPDIADKCPIFEKLGRCRFGWACRFVGGHPEMQEGISDSSNEDARNLLTKEVQHKLNKHQYDHSKADECVARYDKANMISAKKDEQIKNSINNDSNNDSIVESNNVKLLGALGDAEKVKIDWKDKLYLTPLTTVGNLPFRRLCKRYGADITCGEMAMAIPLLQGTQEWALCKRHESEDIFGIQICGNNPRVLTRAAQVIEEQTKADFIDLNLGCPIDMVYRQGGGCGMLQRERLLEASIRSLVDVTNIPITVKTRTGVYQNKFVADYFLPRFRDWGVSAVTLHGRTREQRYTKYADWEYIAKCAELASPMPVIGNGDILSSRDYITARNSAPAVASVAIGRGALIKPWIFTEIKENRDWDISANERLDLVKDYVHYGLEHWGSDTKGVETTRRFLLEWLSFTHRYIPVGVLEEPPQRINERPPIYRGRDDLETLLSSPNCADWVKISEMVLGKAPEGFRFLPKHKANSWR